MSADFALPEVAEADASGDIAALYETIRADTGSRLVNYVWRHLASIDGAAPWLWQVTRANDHRPLAALVGRTADAAAGPLAAETRPVAPVAMDAAAQDIVAVYNVNNVGNLSRVFMLLEALRRPSGEARSRSAAPAAGRANAPADAALPPLPRFSDLSQAELDAIAAIAEAGPAADSGIVPSLWRHLAVEPGLIERLRAPLAAALASPHFVAAFDDLRARAMTAAADIPLTLPPPARFDRAAATLGLARFSRRIAELTLAGRVLTEWTRAPADPSSAAQESRP